MKTPLVPPSPMAPVPSLRGTPARAVGPGSLAQHHGGQLIGRQGCCRVASLVAGEASGRSWPVASPGFAVRSLQLANVETADEAVGGAIGSAAPAPVPARWWPPLVVNLCRSAVAECRC